MGRRKRNSRGTGPGREPPVIELAMRLASLEAVANRPLPQGLALRWFRPGDEERWRLVQEATGTYGPVSPALFREQFGRAAAALARRQVYALDGHGTAVGTATAWHGEGTDRAGGRVHWVAVVPPWQRRGVGASLTSVACRRLRELGHTSAYLTTGSANIAAIRLYLGLGFLPWPRTEQERTAWRRLRADLEPRFGRMLREGAA